jgi:hypothetical protein
MSVLESGLYHWLSVDFFKLFNSLTAGMVKPFPQM